MSTSNLANRVALRPSDGCQIRIEHIGNDRAPLIVIDNFLQEVEQLVEIAALGPLFQVRPDSYYPGVQRPMPEEYRALVEGVIRSLVPRVFGLGRSPLQNSQSNFAMHTLPVDQASLVQKIPHVDATSTNVFFLLHYLCAGGNWGTSFYRQRETGFETITDERIPAYRAALKRGLEVSPPQQYINGDTALFERIASYEAVFNRALIYRSAGLHSGNVGPGAPTGSDPRRGRLTANSIFLFGAEPVLKVGERQ